MSSNRNVYIIKGVTAFLILLAGVGFFLAFNNGLFDASFPWILVAIAGGVIVLILSGIMLLPRARVQKPTRAYLNIEENYKNFKDLDIGRQNKDFVPSKKYEQNRINETKFCDYCGMVLEEDVSFCINCGNKIE